MSEQPRGPLTSTPPPAGEALRLAVLGDPIAHSRSPQLHRAAAQALGVNWDYQRWQVPVGGLAAALTGRGTGWRGVSVTAPLKAEALAFATKVSERAERAGAANTLVFDHLGADAPACADNTDVPGIIAALAETGVTRITGPVDVLGSGGTAASASLAAVELGATSLRIAARNYAHAQLLGERVGSWSSGISIELVDLARWCPSSHTELVVDTVPRGFEAGALLGAAPHGVLFSAAYDPWPTPLAALWSAAGLPVANGAAMLLHQAVLQVRWFAQGSVTAPLPNEAEVVARMREALAAP